MHYHGSWLRRRQLPIHLSRESVNATLCYRDIFGHSIVTICPIKPQDTAYVGIVSKAGPACSTLDQWIYRYPVTPF